MSLREKLRIPSNKEFGYYELKKVKEKYPDEDIDGFVDELMELVDSGIYNKLFNVYINWEEPVPLNSPRSNEIALESSLLVLASQNLKNKPFKFSSDLIDYSTFYFFLPFLEWVYSMHLGRRLISEDVAILFRSDIAEKITLNLLYFDKAQNKVEITPEFFQSLSKLKWIDRKTKNLSSKLENVLGFFAFEEQGMNENSFIVRQKRVILFLAGCSAVKKGKNVINTQDIILAYRTFFKIIRTDISKIID